MNKCSTDRPDIRVGDLVRATKKDNPEMVWQSRVHWVGADWVDTNGRGFCYFRNWDFEVLDRPLPPIDEELLVGARNAYRKGHYGHQPVEFPETDKSYKAGVEAVINYVREYDRTHNKENA